MERPAGTETGALRSRGLSRRPGHRTRAGRRGRVRFVTAPHPGGSGEVGGASGLHRQPDENATHSACAPGRPHDATCSSPACAADAPCGRGPPPLSPPSGSRFLDRQPLAQSARRTDSSTSRGRPAGTPARDPASGAATCSIACATTSWTDTSNSSRRSTTSSRDRRTAPPPDAAAAPPHAQRRPSPLPPLHPLRHRARKAWRASAAAGPGHAPDRAGTRTCAGLDGLDRALTPYRQHVEDHRFRAADWIDSLRDLVRWDRPRAQRQPSGASGIHDYHEEGPRAGRRSSRRPR